MGESPACGLDDKDEGVPERRPLRGGAHVKFRRRGISIHPGCAAPREAAACVCDPMRAAGTLRAKPPDVRPASLLIRVIRIRRSATVAFRRRANCRFAPGPGRRSDPENASRPLDARGQAFPTRCPADQGSRYSTVTDFARLRGWSTSVPFATAAW
jgi:hypothetical protein